MNLVKTGYFLNPSDVFIANEEFQIRDIGSLHISQTCLSKSAICIIFVSGTSKFLQEMLVHLKSTIIKQPPQAQNVL